MKTFIVFECLKPRWNMKHEFLKLLLQQKKISLNYHLNKVSQFNYYIWDVKCAWSYHLTAALWQFWNIHQLMSHCYLAVCQFWENTLLRKANGDILKLAKKRKSVCSALFRGNLYIWFEKISNVSAILGLKFTARLKVSQNTRSPLLSENIKFRKRMGFSVLGSLITVPLHSTLAVNRAKNFCSSARPRRVLCYILRVDLQKHLSQGTSGVCQKKKMFFSTEVWVPKHFGLCKLAWVSQSLHSFHGNLPVFASVFQEYLVVVSVKTGIHIPYMEMTTSFETRLHIWLHNTYTRRLTLWQVLWSLKK